MSENTVVYSHDSLFSGDYVWTRVYGGELLNFISCYDERLTHTVESWKRGEERFILKPAMNEILSCFPLPYNIEYS